MSARDVLRHTNSFWKLFKEYLLLVQISTFFQGVCPHTPRDMKSWSTSLVEDERYVQGFGSKMIKILKWTFFTRLCPLGSRCVLGIILSVNNT